MFRSHFETHPEQSRLHPSCWPQNAATFDWNEAPFEVFTTQWPAVIFTFAGDFFFFLCFFFLKMERHRTSGLSLFDGWHAHWQKCDVGIDHQLRIQGEVRRKEEDCKLGFLNITINRPYRKKQAHLPQCRPGSGVRPSLFYLSMYDLPRGILV